MSKFKISLELTGLKLAIEGERQDIPLLTKAVAAQIAGQMMPAASIADGRIPDALPGSTTVNGTAHVVSSSTTQKKSKSRRNGSGSANGADGAGKPIVWTHDANTWGSPLQTWKAVDKAVWLLYVAKQSGAASEMTVHQLVTSFDKLFRLAGKLNRGNIARDFANLNSEPPPKVQTNGAVDPQTWYLTDAGNRYAESLVKAARGEPVA